MKKLMLILLVGMFLISFTSALEFDNVKYERDKTFNGKDIVGDKLLEKYKPIEIKNTFGLGETLFEGYLSSHDELCGSECESLIEIKTYSEGPLLNDFQLKKLKNDGSWEDTTIKDLRFYIKTEQKEVLINKYAWSCEGEKTYPNGSVGENCVEKKVDSYYETEPLWAPYNYESKPAGQYTLKVEGKKSRYETIDWIIKTNGEWLNEWATWGNISGGDQAEVLLISPANASNASSETFNFTITANVTNGANLTNVSLYHNGTGTWHLNQTIANLTTYSNVTTEAPSGVSLSSAGSTTDSNRGVKMIPLASTRIINVTKDSSSTATYCALRDDSNSELINGTFVGDGCTLNYDVTAGTIYRIVINSEGSSYVLYRDAGASFPYLSTNSLINYTMGINSAGGNDTSVWYSVANVIVGQQDALNFTQQSFTTPIFSSGIWNVEGCDDEGACGFAVNNFTVGSNVLINSTTFNTSAYETDQETFILQTTINSGSSITNANLYYNGTANAATVTTNGVDVNISKTLDIETGPENRSLFFSFDIDGQNFNTTSNQQNISETVFALCNGTYSDLFLNVSFKDEENSSLLNASVTSSTFKYWLGSGAYNKTLSYTNSSTNQNYSFCSNVGSKILNVDPIIKYKFDPDYPQRTWDGPSESYNNTTVTNKVLFLLSVNDGIYVTFQVVNSAEQIISDVFINATRSISSVTELVEQGFTDSAGALTMWLHPDFVHTFNFAKTGYSTLISSFAPTQSTYTITLGSTSTTTQDDLTRGISYTVKPTDSTLNNDTSYNFNFTLNSSYWEVSNFGFILKNSTGDVIGSDFETTNGGSADTDVNVGNNTEVVMEYFWTINSTNSTGTRTWLVLDSGGTGYSVSFFFTDLSTYLSSGLFGLDNFGLAVFIFIAIFMVTGIMSFKYGIQSPAAISMLVFAQVLFFDVGLNLLTSLNPFNAVSHFPTIFMGLIALSMLIGEAIR